MANEALLLVVGIFALSMVTAMRARRPLLAFSPAIVIALFFIPGIIYESGRDHPDANGTLAALTGLAGVVISVAGSLTGRLLRRRGLR